MERQDQSPLEIERKFLIRFPDTARLTAEAGCRVLRMTQTYLTAEPGCTHRVRAVQENGEVRFFQTQKRRISALTATEEESELSQEAYTALLALADPLCRPIQKTRFAFPFDGHVMEVDVYPFWSDRAILEIELSSEEEAFRIPPCLSVIREVTADQRYKNVSLAREILYETV